MSLKMIHIKYAFLLTVSVLVIQSQGQSCSQYPGDLLRVRRGIKLALDAYTKYCFVTTVSPVRGVIVDPTKSEFNEAFYIVDQNLTVHRLARRFDGRLDAFVMKDSKYSLLGKGMGAREHVLWAVANSTKTFYYLFNSSLNNNWEHETKLKQVDLHTGGEQPDKCRKKDYFFAEIYLRRGWTRNFSIQWWDQRKFYLRRPNDHPYEDEWGNSLGRFHYWNYAEWVTESVDTFYKWMYGSETRIPCYVVLNALEKDQMSGIVLFKEGYYGYFDNFDDGLAMRWPQSGRVKIPIYMRKNKTIDSINMLVFNPRKADRLKAFYILDGNYDNYTLIIDGKKVYAKPEKYRNEGMIESIRNRKPICASTNWTNFYYALEKDDGWKPTDPRIRWCKYFLFYGKDKVIPFGGYYNFRIFAVPRLTVGADRFTMYEFGKMHCDSEWKIPCVEFSYDSKPIGVIDNWQENYAINFDREDVMPYYIINDDKDAYAIFKNGTYAYIPRETLDSHNIFTEFIPYSAQYIRVFREKGGEWFGG